MPKKKDSKEEATGLHLLEVGSSSRRRSSSELHQLAPPNPRQLAFSELAPLRQPPQAPVPFQFNRIVYHSGIGRISRLLKPQGSTTTVAVNRANQLLATYSQQARQHLVSLPSMVKEDGEALVQELRTIANSLKAGKEGVVREIERLIGEVERYDAALAIFFRERPIYEQEQRARLFAEESRQELQALLNEQVPFVRSNLSEPKAGFEMEWNNVLIRSATEGAARYKKRQVLFTSPGGTWSGTADSTLANDANLEVIFGLKGLSRAFWADNALADPQNAASSLAAEATVLADFANWVQGLPENTVTLLTAFNQLGGSQLTLVDPTAVICKTSTYHDPQVQMTAANHITPQGDAPAWWLPDLNYDAYPYIRKATEAFTNTEAMARANNPKEIFNNTILKTPIPHILGCTNADEAVIAAWVKAMGTQTRVDLDKKVGARVFDGLKKHFQVKKPSFTWRDYFTGLAYGIDRIQLWAKTAFVGENEDIGYGQIADANLSRKWVIEEQRSGHDFTSYRAKAKEWATNAQQHND